ncbi:MAG: hypothetical protein KME30_15695 [Iphinoe sp. HA4291-MV1]|nr:hypothetical protein [Iphinoe sp. HA4291-MV1]
MRLVLSPLGGAYEKHVPVRVPRECMRWRKSIPSGHSGSGHTPKVSACSAYYKPISKFIAKTYGV